MPKGFRSNFTFGGIMAEKDPLLSTTYWDNGDFETIISPEDPRCFLIGRTGSGKSALLHHLEENYPNKVVRIIPENLSLPYITNLGVIRQLLELEVRLEPFLKALWKHVILVEILRHRYDITSPERKQTILSLLKDKFKRDPGKVKAIEYLDEFGDKFWCEADERIKQIAETFENKIVASAGLDLHVGSLDMKGSSNAEGKHSREMKSELATRYQRVVNEAQIPRLNEMMNVLNEEALTAQHFTYVIIDDLDKEWEDEVLANLLIRCLLQAVIDIQRIKHLKVLVALRTNIFQQLNYGEQSRGGQEEKFRGVSLTLRWTERDLCSLLENRAEAASHFYHLDPPKTLSQMFPKVNKGAGDPLAYILRRTLMRPRDAILYLNACVREATGKERITWEDIRQAERGYSEERLFAPRDEWKDPYLDIDKVLERFRYKPARMNVEELIQVLEDIALLPANPGFRGDTWLKLISEPIWAPENAQRSWYEWYGQIVNLLYRISFLGLAKGMQARARYSFDESDRVLSASDLPESIIFEIHPAFYKALDIDDQRVRSSSQK
jgi:hypothetical protein